MNGSVLAAVVQGTFQAVFKQNQAGNHDFLYWRFWALNK